MILAGLSGIIVVEIYAAIMQMEFQDTDNKIGKGFAVLGIYLFVVTYCMSPHPSESHISIRVMQKHWQRLSTDWLSQMACSTALPGYMAPKYCLLLSAARSWASRLLHTSSLMLAVSVFRLVSPRLRAARTYPNNHVVTEAGPTAYATIKQNYYYVFVGCTLFFLTVAYFYFP